MKDRIKSIRISKKMSQEEFGKKLGVTKGAISRIENGSNNVTEQMQKIICREFNVDYIWLTTGEGEMFINQDDDALAAIEYIMTGEPNFRKRLFERLAKADDEFWISLERVIDEIAEVKKDQ